MMIVQDMSTTTNPPVQVPRGLVDADVQLRHIEEAIRDDVILSANLLTTERSNAFQEPFGQQVRQEGLEMAPESTVPTWSEGEESSTMDVILTSDLPEWLRASLPRLLRLCDMEPNWDSYGSSPPSLRLIKRIVRSLRLAEIETFPEPEVVPANGGGVQLEWYLGKRELELEFTATGHIEYLRTDNERREEKEGVIKDLDDLRSLLGWVDRIG